MGQTERKKIQGTKEAEMSSDVTNLLLLSDATEINNQETQMKFLWDPDQPIQKWICFSQVCFRILNWCLIWFSSEK